MKTIELKKKLIKRINNIEDDLLLEELSWLIDAKGFESGVYHFTEEEREAIEEAQLDYAKGEFLTNEEANKEVDEWLGE